jgi:hypothetical protein
MKNFLSLLVIFVSGCGASAGDPSVDYGGAGGEQTLGAGSGGTSGATAIAGAGNSGLGGFGNGGNAGGFEAGGASGQGTNNAGAFSGGGTFGAAGTGGGLSFGGIGGSGAIGGSGGTAGHAAGGSAGFGGSGGSLGSAGSVGAAGSAGASAQVCTSKKTWTGGNGPDMRPGNDCRGCHSFTIDGTVFPTLNEPNNCDGTGAAGVKVLITGSDNVTLTLTPSATSGNFYSNTTVKTPFSVKLTNSAGKSRSMVAHQTAGNCNSCHTPTGANGAPGRIMAP